MTWSILPSAFQAGKGSDPDDPDDPLVILSASRANERFRFVSLCAYLYHYPR